MHIYNNTQTYGQKERKKKKRKKKETKQKQNKIIPLSFTLCLQDTVSFPQRRTDWRAK